MAAFVIACACVIGVVPAAFAATASPTGYSISTEATGEYDQHVLVTVDYGSAVNITSEEALQGSLTGASPTATITIAGRDITSDAYYRPVTFSASGNSLIIDIGNCEDALGAPAFTAQYSGVIDVDGTLAGVTVGGDTLAPLDIYTVIPTGVALTATGQGTDEVTATVSHLANVRGMVHIGIYEKNGSGTLVPISPSAGVINVYTYVIHAHNFTTMTLSQYASAIAALSLPTGYTIGASGDTITLTSSDSSSQLYLYIFDDDLLQDLDQTFTGVNTGEGEMTPPFD